MYKLKNQIEGQIQEITFFSSLLIAFTIFVSGVFYLALGNASLQLVLGTFGTSIDRAFFSAFGYGFFYLAFAALHMGYITNFHIFNFNDLKREYPVLAYSALAHLILLTLFSNFLSVIQFSLEIPVSENLPYGSGGFVGTFIAKGLYSIAGVYGSILILVIFKVMTALVAEFFELKDLHQALRTLAQVSKVQSIRLVKTTHQILSQSIQFFLKGSDFTDMAYQSSHATKAWISNSAHRASHLFTEHFHIYNRPATPKEETSSENKEKLSVKRKPVKAKTASEKLLAVKSKKSMAVVKKEKIQSVKRKNKRA